MLGFNIDIETVFKVLYSFLLAVTKVALVLPAILIFKYSCYKKAYICCNKKSRFIMKINITLEIDNKKKKSDAVDQYDT